MASRSLIRSVAKTAAATAFGGPIAGASAGVNETIDLLVGRLGPRDKDAHASVIKQLEGDLEAFARSEGLSASSVDRALEEVQRLLARHGLNREKMYELDLVPAAISGAVLQSASRERAYLDEDVRELSRQVVHTVYTTLLSDEDMAFRRAVFRRLRELHPVVEGYARTEHPEGLEVSRVRQLTGLTPCVPVSRLLPKVRPFCGRADELRRITAAVGSSTSLEISGEEGIGKTSLVSEALRLEGVAPPDGILCVDPDYKTVDDVRSYIFDAVYEPAPEVTPRVGHMDKCLAGLELLIVLDDTSESMNVARLRRILPNSRLLLTSESQIAPAEGDRLELSGLSREAAVELFQQMLDREVSAEEGRAIADYRDAVHGHTMSLRRAAALLQDGRFGAAELRRLAAGAEPRERLEADQLSTLDPDTRKVLTLLRLLGNATLGFEQIAAVTGVQEVPRVVSELETLGLAQTHSARASASTPVFTRAGGDDEEHLVAAALDHFATARLSDADLRDNAAAVLSILEHGSRRHQWASVLSAARTVERALAPTGRWEGWRSALAHATAAALATHDEEAFAWAVHEQGVRGSLLGDPYAKGLIWRAREVRIRLRDSRALGVSARTLGNLGGITPLRPAETSRTSRSLFFFSTAIWQRIRAAADARREEREQPEHRYGLRSNPTDAPRTTARAHELDPRLERYRPALCYDPQEVHRAISAASITDSPGNALTRSDGTVVALAGHGLSLDLLAGYDARPGDRIDPTPIINTNTRFQRDPAYANRVYGRALEDGGRTWLQYWLFFYYKYEPPDGLGSHQGDWKLIQVGLGADGVPEAVTYGQLHGAEGRGWANVRVQGEHLIAYVAPFSHSCYFEPGAHPYVVGVDHPDDSLHPILPRVEPFGAWRAWSGRWGNTSDPHVERTSSPVSPALQGQQWDHPATWHRRALPGTGPAQGSGRLVRSLGRATYPKLLTIEPRREADRLLVDYELDPVPQRRASHLLVTVHRGEAMDEVVASRTPEVSESAGTVSLPLPDGSGPRLVVRASAYNVLRQRSDTLTSPVTV